MSANLPRTRTIHYRINDNLVVVTHPDKRERELTCLWIVSKTNSGDWFRTNLDRDGIAKLLKTGVRRVTRWKGSDASFRVTRKAE